MEEKGVNSLPERHHFENLSVTQSRFNFSKIPPVSMARSGPAHHTENDGLYTVQEFLGETQMVGGLAVIHLLIAGSGQLP